MHAMHIIAHTDRLYEVLLALLPALQGQGIRTEVLVLFETTPPPASFIAHMKKQKIAVLGYKAPQLHNLHHPNTPQTILHLAQMLHHRAPHLIHTHLPSADFLGGFAAKWAHIAHRVRTRYPQDDTRHGAHWREVARLFEAHIVTTPQQASVLHHQEGVPHAHIHPLHETDALGVFALYKQLMQTA